MKIGVEVEGSYKGLKTLFIEQNELDKVLDKIKSVDVSQVYISCNMYITGEQFIIIKKLLKTEKLITIDTAYFDFIPKSIINKVNIILLVDDSDFFKLKPTDQIKFEIGRKVYTAKKETMIKTLPSDYKRDKELK